MATEKSLAIVLRVVEFSETSLIVTLFTEQLGKIGALAKGARRPKSPFEAALDLLAVCRIVFIHKSSDALDLLTEAKLERRFRAATRDLSRLYAGYYVTELLHDLTDNGDPHPVLFQAANQTLFDLDNGAAVASTVLWFELVLLRELGLLPSLQACVGCGESVERGERVAFGMLAGGVLCSRCRPGQRSVVGVRGKVIATMEQLADTNPRPMNAQQTDSRQSEPRRMEISLERAVSNELRGLLNNYLSHVLGRRPRMYKYLGMLNAGQ